MGLVFLICAGNMRERDGKIAKKCRKDQKMAFFVSSLRLKQYRSEGTQMPDDVDVSFHTAKTQLSSRGPDQAHFIILSVFHSMIFLVC